MKGDENKSQRSPVAVQPILVPEACCLGKGAPGSLQCKCLMASDQMHSVNGAGANGGWGVAVLKSSLYSLTNINSSSMSVSLYPNRTHCQIK